MIIEKKVYELASEGSHKLEIVEIGELKTYETVHGKLTKFTIKVKVLDQKATKDGSDLYVFLTVSPSIGVKATLGKFLRRLKFNVTDKFDVDDLIEVQFRSHIAYNEGTGNNVGTTFANIVIDTVTPALASKPVTEEF